MDSVARRRAKSALLTGYAVVAALAATFYGALHGHEHGDSTLDAHGHSGASTGNGHVHPDAALLVAGAGLGVVALTWALLPADRRRTLPGQLALCSAAAATIHFAFVWPHWDEYVPFALAFALAGAFQLAWAPLLLVRPRRRLLAAGAAVNAAIALAWVLSRAVGLPVGPEEWSPEPVGLADSAATVFELAIAAGALLLSRRLGSRLQGGAARLAAQGPAVAIGTTLLVALTLL
jgi:hypothetical protein